MEENQQTPVKMFKFSNCKFLLVIAVYQLVLAVSVAEHVQIPVGFLMMKQLTRSAFFSETDAPPSAPVRYIPSEQGIPDPPPWLHFVQRGVDHDGFLYGMPRSQGDNASVEIVAINERTQQTAYSIMDISVLPPQEDQSSLHVLELWVLSHDVEEILKGRLLASLTDTLARLWGVIDDDLSLVNVLALPTVTGRTPVPSNPGQEVKEGVLLQFGCRAAFSKRLEAVADQVADGRCSVTDRASVEVDVQKRFSPDLRINWCQLKLIPPVSPPPPPSGPLGLPPAPWTPRTAGVPRRDLFLDFIWIVVVPSALGLGLFVLISVIMFGGREGRDKRDKETSDTQLMQYHTIRQATTNLRYMSTQRETLPSMTPRLGRTPANTPGPSAANTLSRPDRVGTRASPPPGQAPPPYRPPPTFPNTLATANWSRETEPVATSNQNEPITDEDQLVPQGSPETLKVRK